MDVAKSDGLISPNRELLITQERTIDSFAIDADSIMKIWRKFEEFSDGDISVIFKTTKDKTYTSYSIDQLIHFENPVEEQIIKFSISCRRGIYHSMEFYVCCFESFYSTKLSYKISSLEPWVSSCSDCFDKIISGIKTKNGYIRKKYDLDNMTTYFIIVLWTGLVSFFVESMVGYEHNILINFMLSMPIMTIIIAITFYTRAYISKTIKRLYPTGTILIGQNVVRYESKNKERERLFGNFIIPILLSFILQCLSIGLSGLFSGSFLKIN